MDKAFGINNFLEQEQEISLYFYMCIYRFRVRMEICFIKLDMYQTHGRCESTVVWYTYLYLTSNHVQMLNEKGRFE